LYFYGYLPADVTGEVREQLNKTFKLKVKSRVAKVVAVQRDLGLAVPGIAPPMPDLRDTSNVVMSLKSRVGSCPNSSFGRVLRKRVESFGRLFCRNFRRLSMGDVLPTPEWIEALDKPRWYKDELYASYKGQKPCRDFGRHGFFIKAETYPRCKVPRGINAPTSEAKVKFGPAVSAMEDSMFSHGMFIKYVPGLQRLQVIHERLAGGGKFWETDFSRFEASFSKDLMRCFEVAFFKYMLRDVDPGLAREMADYDMGVHKIHRQNVSCKVEAVRMSGDMWTSLANSFTNAGVCCFALKRMGILDLCSYVFEGDDGLIRVPAWADPKEFERILDELGLYVKIIETHTLGEADFCRKVCGEFHKQLVKEPRYEILKFCFTHAQQMCGKEPKLRGLLRAKALSLKCELPACPILTALADAALRLTEGYEAVWDPKDYYSKHVVESTRVVGQEILGETRGLFAHLYGVPVATQVQIESCLAKVERVRPLHELDGLMREHDHWLDWHNYWLNYQATSFVLGGAV
jgi:hypothetical protein